MKILILTLTGFGNSVIKGLTDSDFIDDIFVVTRQESGKFPHYPCKQLTELCNERNIEYILDNKAGFSFDFKNILKWPPDIIITATFHRVIPAHITRLSKLISINIHPSLLPAYRGPTPTNWAIINGEEETGITIHELTQEIDMGDILFQKKARIGLSNNGHLRQKLASLAENSMEDFFKRLINGSLYPIKQDKNEGSHFPKITSRLGIEMLKSGRFSQSCIKRGMAPYPGLSILK